MNESKCEESLIELKQGLGKVLGANLGAFRAISKNIEVLKNGFDASLGLIKELQERVEELEHEKERQGEAVGK